jgi:hypothetical protein
MRISGSILITTAFVSAMLVLQESSATAQTCKDTQQKQYDACSSYGAPCGPCTYYGCTGLNSGCEQCRHDTYVALNKCINAKAREQIRQGVTKPGGSTLGTNTPPKSKQPPIKPVSVGGANTDNNNQSGGRSDTQRTGGGSKH